VYGDTSLARLNSSQIRAIFCAMSGLIKPSAPLSLPMQRNRNEQRVEKFPRPTQHPAGKGRYKVMPIFTFEGQNHTVGFGIIQKHSRPCVPESGFVQVIVKKNMRIIVIP